MKHTKGPWKHNDMLSDEWPVIVSAHNHIVASVRDTCGYCASSKDRKELKGNVALIAAAPDLLEAALEISNARRAYIAKDGRDILTSCSWNKLDRAISLAEGKE